MIAPLSVNFLGTYQVSEMVSNQINLSSFISTVTTITFACGIIFQLPIVIYFLDKFRCFDSPDNEVLSCPFNCGALIISAVITPPDLSVKYW